MVSTSVENTRLDLSVAVVGGGGAGGGAAAAAIAGKEALITLQTCGPLTGLSERRGRRRGGSGRGGGFFFGRRRYCDAMAIHAEAQQLQWNENESGRLRETQS